MTDFGVMKKKLVSELVYFLACEQVPGGGGGQSQVTVPFFRRELAVRAFWPKAILCRLAFKGLCSGAWDQIKYNSSTAG